MRNILILVIFICTCLSASAQINIGKGQLSGSLESNSIFYVEDLGVPGSLNPADKFASNNYLKLDFNLGKFSAGIQVEAFLPAILGYDMALYGTKDVFLSGKYVQWVDDNFSIYVGDIYEQFGNGLIFRSYEDRALGFNNSLEGIRVTYDLGNYLTVKGMYGRPRLYDVYAGSWVRGADLSLSVSDLFKWNSGYIALEGSYVNRYEKLDNGDGLDFGELYGIGPNLDMYSARVIFDSHGFSLNAEYALKGNKDVYNTAAIKAKNGDAIYAQLGYNMGDFGFSAEYRRLEYMGVLASIYGDGTGNTLNYLPALTRQYTYMLANLNPHQVNTSGEIAYQADAFYTLNSRDSRSRWWNFHANFSYAGSLAAQSETGKSELMWYDANFDVERQWSKSFKTSFLFSRQAQTTTPGYYTDGEMFVSNIFVVDMTYKINRRSALRLELQYLLADDYTGEVYDAEFEGDWVAALLEYSFAPTWSIYVSDMYNIGLTDTHYYNVGLRYTKNRTSVQLSYGRNKEGFVCSGGVCRFQPAYTGFAFSVVSSF